MEKQLIVRVSEELKTKLKVESVKMGKPMKDVVIEAIEKFLRDKEMEKGNK